jgi:hypothetical protein
MTVMSTQVALRKATEKELIAYIKVQQQRISSLQEELKTFNDELRAKQNKARVRGRNQFTDAMYLALLRGGEASVWSRDAAKAFAEKHKITTASVIAKIKKLGMAYQAVPSEEADAAQSANREEVIDQISRKIRLPKDKIKGLARNNIDTLRAMLAKMK